MALLALYGLLATIVFDTLIAWVISSLTDIGFWHNWQISNIFGFSFYSWSLIWATVLNNKNAFKITLLSFLMGLTTALLILSRLYPSHLRKT